MSLSGSSCTRLLARLGLSRVGISHGVCGLRKNSKSKTSSFSRLFLASCNSSKTSGSMSRIRKMETADNAMLWLEINHLMKLCFSGDLRFVSD